MFSFLKKEKKEFKLSEINAKLVFFILSCYGQKYIKQYNIISIKNINNSIVALIQNTEKNSQNDICNVVCKQQYNTFDLSCLNQYSCIYFQKGCFTINRPLDNKYITPCGIVTCKMGKHVKQNCEDVFDSLSKSLSIQCKFLNKTNE